jgi:hypothetical protein
MLPKHNTKKIIVESIMDQETTRLSYLIIRDIVDYFFSNSSKQKRKILTYESTMGFPVEVFVYEANTDRPQIVKALYYKDIYNDENGISLEIQIPKSKDKRTLSDFVIRLKQALRHEIEHARQDQRGIVYGAFSSRDWDVMTADEVFGNAMGALNYYLRPSEIEAYTMQLYKKAKMIKKPFLDVLDAWLESLEKRFKFESKKIVISYIKKAMLDYAKKRLPTLKL